MGWIKLKSNDFTLPTKLPTKWNRFPHHFKALPKAGKLSKSIQNQISAKTLHLLHRIRKKPSNPKMFFISWGNIGQKLFHNNEIRNTTMIFKLKPWDSEQFKTMKFKVNWSPVLWPYSSTKCIIIICCTKCEKNLLDAQYKSVL